MINLYYAYPACSMATHIALEESGLEYKPILANVYDSAARSEYLKINPKGTIPAITVDDELLTENVAILGYIGRLGPRGLLLPDDEWLAAQCMSFLAWCSSTVHIAFRQGFRPERFSADEAAHDGIRQAGRIAYWNALKAMDARLSGQAYMLGERFSLADTYPLVFYNWGIIGSYPIDELESLSAFKDRMLARPAVQTVMAREGCPLSSAI